MAQKGWRQFRPRTRTRHQGLSDDFVGYAHTRLDELIDTRGSRKDTGIERLHTLAEEQGLRVVSHPTAGEWFTLLLLRAPGAARAQEQMDSHPHGYHDKQARLLELIDFNDAFVSTVLALKHVQRQDFISIAKQEIEQMCKTSGSRSFSDEQYDAITRGLSREVAVYLGAIEQGYSVAMTSRSQDAMGVDMVITDPIQKRSLNIDCKTSSAYHYRIKDLVQQGRLTPQEGVTAEDLGYAHEINGQGSDAVAVTLLRIDPNEVGEIEGFTFTRSSLLGERLAVLFESLPLHTAS